MNNKRPLTSKTRIQNNKNKNIKNKKNSNTGYITLSDFERIKNTIDPKKENEYTTSRKIYEQRLKSASNYHKNRFPKSYNQSFKDREKELFIKRELAQRKIDEIEEKEHQKENEFYSNLAKEKIFKSKDEIRSFQSSLMLSDALNERNFQNNIKNNKKLIEQEINQKHYLNLLENLKEFDRKENEKNEILKQKKIDTMNMIKNQIHQSQIKKIKENEEKEIEGIIIKKNYLIALEEDRKKK